MVLFLVAVLSAACVAGSARRLAFVVGATPIDPAVLTTGLRSRNAWLPAHLLRALHAALSSEPGSDWEGSIIVALQQPSQARAALVGEAMTELDFRARRWARVPRVSASLASSFGFLLATVALRVGLAELGGAVDPGASYSMNGAVFDAVDAAAIGLVGTAFCIAIQYRARAALARRMAGADALVQVLEGMAEDDGGALVRTDNRASVAPLTAGLRHARELPPRDGVSLEDISMAGE